MFYDVVDLVAEHNIKTPEDITDDLYVTELKALVAKHSLGRSFILTALPADRAVIRIVDIDAEAQEEDLSATLQAELEEISAQPLEDMEVACHQIETGAGAGDRISLLACAIPNDELARHRRIFRESGLAPSVVDLDVFGLYNVLHYFLSKKVSTPITIVHIGAVYTICVIMHPGRNPFFQVISHGANDISTAIMTKIGLPIVKVAPFEAKTPKRRPGRKAEAKKPDPAEMRMAFTKKLVTEVKKCIRHYQSSQSVADVHGIFLTGGGAPLDLLLDEFNKKTSFRTDLWNPLQFFPDEDTTTDGPNDSSLGFHLGPVLGTLLRGV